MPIRKLHITTTPVDVADATWTKILDRGGDYSMAEVLNETSGAIYVAFQDTEAAPADITTAVKIASDGKYRLDHGEMSEQYIYAYHELGADVDSSTATSPSDNAIKVLTGK
jgi:hypothetical protein